MSDVPLAGLTLVAALVGVVVGMTGMGGGALLTPALIWCGIPLVTAVAHDLVAAAATKTAGAATHWRRGLTADRAIAGWLMLGSVPTAFGAGLVAQRFDGPGHDEWVVRLIAVALLASAGASWASARGSARRNRRRDDTEARRPVVALVLVGVVCGTLVGITSVGSGVLVMGALLVLFPRHPTRTLVGVDLLQAVPLVLAAATAYLLGTDIHWPWVGALVLGGAPGAMVGARLAHRIPPAVLRAVVVGLLVASALMLLGVPWGVSTVLGAVAGVGAARGSTGRQPTAVAPSG